MHSRCYCESVEDDRFLVEELQAGGNVEGLGVFRKGQVQFCLTRVGLSSDLLWVLSVWTYLCQGSERG